MLYQKKTITLVLNDMPIKVTLRNILDVFEEHGELCGLKITPREIDNKPKRVGFVTFNKAEDGRKYMADKNNQVKLLDTDVSMSFAKRSLNSKKNDAYTRAGFHKTRVHVSGFPNTLTEKDLCEMLGDCKLFMPKAPPKGGDGYCFADYPTEQEKNEIVMKLDGKKVDGKYTLKIAPAFLNKRNDFIYKKKRGDEMTEEAME